MPLGDNGTIVVRRRASDDRGRGIRPFPASGPRLETNWDPREELPVGNGPAGADEAVANQERDLASGEENAS